MESGIYLIKGPNGREYVGSAVNFATRWQKHRMDLRNRRHHCQPLQRAFDKHGETAFEFSILCRVARPELLTHEQAALDQRTKAQMYNTCRTAGSRLGNKATPKAIENMRAAKRAQTAETRAKISATHLTAGTRPSRAALLKGVAARLAKPMSQATRAKIAAANRGRVQPPEERARRAAAKRHGMTVANTTGVVGVHRHSSGKWMARVNVNGIRLYLGLFDTLDAAALAVADAKAR